MCNTLGLVVCEECGLVGYGWHCGFCLGELGWRDELRAAELQLASEAVQEVAERWALNGKRRPGPWKGAPGAFAPPGRVAVPTS